MYLQSCVFTCDCADEWKGTLVNTVRNEKVLRKVDEFGEILKVIRTRKRNWLAHWMGREFMLIERGRKR